VLAKRAEARKGEEKGEKKGKRKEKERTNREGSCS